MSTFRIPARVPRLFWSWLYASESSPAQVPATPPRRNYELTGETKELEVRDPDGYLYTVIVRRIRARVDYPDHSVRKGALGGFVQSEDNLLDNAWVADDACVFENARVSGRALINGSARVYGEALVSGGVHISGGACVYDKAQVFDSAYVLDKAQVFDSARVNGHAVVAGEAKVLGRCLVTNSARVFGKALVGGQAWLTDSTTIGETAVVIGEAHVGMPEYTYIGKDARITSTKQVLYMGRIGSENVVLTLYQGKDVPMVTVGCWNGRLSELATEAERRINAKKDCGDISARRRTALLHEYDRLVAFLTTYSRRWSY
jgi:carbonic anhydrase/acetyltransferase-like protein (isoleucine patch superfamily)